MPFEAFCYLEQLPSLHRTQSREETESHLGSMHLVQDESEGIKQLLIFWQ